VSDEGNPQALLAGLRQHEKGTIGLAVSDPDRFFLLRAKTDAAFAALRSIPAVLADLDVTLLHEVLLKRILGMSEADQEKKLYLAYEKDAARAFDSVRRKGSQSAFIMNPTRIEQVRAVASSGMVMPQKSTFFYPKILSGLVTYSFDEIG
jgi:uncharacterized protein (DUF1015 family)